MMEARFTKEILIGVAILIIGVWLSWISTSSVSVDKRVTVIESAISWVRTDMQEMKQIMKEVRGDQVRRQGKED
jgi:hypothetical protein